MCFYDEEIINFGNNKNLVFGYLSEFTLATKFFAWQSSISEELFDEFKQELERRFTVAFKMCDLPVGQHKFKENAYIEST